MINLSLLSKRSSSILSIPCIIIPSPSMALSKWQFMSEDDPWKVSAFVSAVMELFLSILLLLGAAIAFFTSRIVKVFGLEPPCTYIGCSHPLHSHSEGNQEGYTLGLKDHAFVATGVDGYDAHLGRQADHQCSSSDSLLHKRRVRSKHPRCQDFNYAHSSGKLDEDDRALLSAQLNAESSGGVCAENRREISKLSADSEDEETRKETGMKIEDHQCSCSDSLLPKRRARSKRPRRRDFIHAHSNSKLNGAYPALLSVRSSSKSNGGFTAENYCEILQVEQEGECEGTDMKDISVHDAALAHHSEAIKGDTLFEDANKVNASKGKDCEETDVRDEDSFTYETTLAHFSESVEAHTLVEDANKVNASKGEKCEKTGMRDEDFSGRDMTVAHHSEAVKGHALFEYANKVHASKCKDWEERDMRGEVFADHGTTWAHHSEAVKGHTLVVEDANKVHALKGKECKESDRRDEDFCEHGTTVGHRIEAFKGHTLVEDANKVHAFNGKQVHIAESSMECFNKTGNVVDVCDTEHFNPDLLPHEENQCIIQFGSIIARTCIMVGTTSNVNVNSGMIDNTGLVNVARNGGGSLQETGRSESSKDIEILQFHSYVFGDVIATKNSLDEPTPTNDISTCIIESSFAELLEGTSTPIEEKPPSTLPLDDDEDEEEDQQEEGLDALKMALQAERLMLAALEAELENERNAAAVATSEAMAMISRLQEEKSAMQMEVAQLQRTSEERADYDEQAMAVLTEILVKRESQNMALEKEVELYREKLLAGNASEPNGVWYKEALRNLALQTHSKPFLLTGQDIELLSPFGTAAQQQSLTSLGHYCRSKCGLASEGLGEVEGGCGVFVPIHDVYEVGSASNRSPPCEEEKDPPEGFNGALRSKALQAMSREITGCPPRTKPIVSEEIPSTPTSTVQTAGWDIEKLFYPEDFGEHHDLRSRSLVSREERRAELEEIKQLAVRLKALEEDRDLLRETISFRHRDAELSLLQEISQHLRELRMAKRMEVSGGALSEEASLTSPSRSRPLKKRRYCNGLGQAQTPLQHQKSV